MSTDKTSAEKGQVQDLQLNPEDRRALNMDTVLQTCKPETRTEGICENSEERTI
jgi:hypothetical protein